MIRLEDVNPDNWRLELHVREDQKKFVANTTVLPARAYAYRNARSRALVIYDNETPVGMALYYDYEPAHAYNFSQLLIDERYQRKGFGYQAAQLILREMQDDGVYNKVILCYIDGDEPAKQLYCKLGFRHTGDDEEGEIVMEKRLR